MRYDSPVIPARRDLRHRSGPKRWLTRTARPSLLSLLLILQSASLAQLATAYWIDPTGTASVADALAAAEAGAFTAYEEILFQGYVSTPVWFRLELPEGLPGGEAWVLRVRPTWHDEVLLYDPLQIGGEPAVSGDRYPTSNDAYESLNLSFRVPQIDVPRILLLRLDSPHSVIFGAELLPESDARRLDQRQFGWYMAYLAFILVVLASTVLAWLRDRDHLLGSAAINIAVGIAYAASMYGVLRLLLNGVLESEVLNAVNGLLILAYPLSSMFFYRALLRQYGVRRFAATGVDAMIAFEALALTLMALGYAHEAFFLNAVTLTVGSVWVLSSLLFWSTASVDPGKDDLPLWLVRWVATGLLGFTLLGLITGTLGFYFDWGARIEAFLAHSSVVSISMSFGLQYRSRRRQRALVAAERRAELEVVERERLQRFMNMFSHEVRTPLAIVSLAVERGIQDPLLASQARGAITDLNELVSKSLLVDRLEAAAVFQQSEEVDLVELVNDCALRLDLSEAVCLASTDPTWVRVDLYLTHVIATNLLDNAMKYGVVGGRIDVSFARESEASVTMFVGNRIDASGVFDPQRVFEKYYRSPSAGKRSGAGLGLHLSRAFARMQGGDLRVDQLSESYVRFGLEVPA